MNKLMMFEGNEVMVLFPGDVNFDFLGDFIVSAKDVGSVLEYQGEKATHHVLKFCKENHIYNVTNSNLLNRNVRKLHNTGEKFISNLSLNRVLGQSEQPKAIPFQDWLYEDMLPSVSKYGAYMTPATIEKTLSNPDFIIKLATVLKDEQEKNKVLELKIERDKPKVAYYDTILKSKGTVTTSQIAKDYGLRAGQLNKILHEAKIQYKQNDQWLLYSSHDDKGYTQSYAFEITHKDGTKEIKMNTRWTQRGRIMIHQLLVSMDIKPNIEKEYDDAK